MTSERSTLLHRGTAESDARTSHVRVLYLFLAAGIFIFPIFIVQYVTSNSCITVTPAVTQGLIGLLEVVLVLGHLWFTFRKRASDLPPDPPATDTSSGDQPQPQPQPQRFPLSFASKQPSKQKLSVARKVVLFLWVAFGLGSVINFASDAVGLFSVWTAVVESTLLSYIDLLLIYTLPLRCSMTFQQSLSFFRVFQ